MPQASPPLWPDDVETLARLSDEAAADQRWMHALAHVERALALAPASVRLLLNKAFFLERVGLFDEARACYALACDRSPEDGEADLQLALFLASRDADAEEIEPALLRALQKTPRFADDVETDEALRAVCARPAMREALRGARRGKGPVARARAARKESVDMMDFVSRVRRMSFQP